MGPSSSHMVRGAIEILMQPVVVGEILLDFGVDWINNTAV